MIAIRRAVLIGNGVAGAENQCIGLARALGLAANYSLHRVLRPKGGNNEWLRWLPVSLHRKLNYAIRRVCNDLQLWNISKGNSVAPLPTEKSGCCHGFTEKCHQDDVLGGNLKLGSDESLSTGLSSVLEADAKQIANMARVTFDQEGPLLVVASGCDTIAVTSAVRSLAPESVFVVQIQHPRIRLNRFDLVIAPQHDYFPLTPQGRAQIPWYLRRWITPREPPNEHVVLTVGALHQADSASLHSAALTWHDELAPLLKPLLVVNIGGPTSSCPYGMDLVKEFISMLQNVLWSCGSVRISFSRRTPEQVSQALMTEFGTNPKVSIWSGKGPNPHMGHLAWADAFVVTADSVSMLSEACSTGKPVYVAGSEHCTWKFAEFQKTLRDQGAVRVFTGKENMSETWSYHPLNDNAEAAARVHEALAQRGWRIST